MIYVVIPVHNRLLHIKRLLFLLDRQTEKSNIKVFVVDAGSTDGTPEFVIAESNRQVNVQLVEGASDWFWGRSTQEGIDAVLGDLKMNDHVLLLNDDVEIEDSYIEKSMQILARHQNAVLGSVLVDIDTKETFHFGVKCNPKKLLITDLEASEVTSNIFNADLVSGRGTFYPASLFLFGLKLNWKEIPHYLSDYDLSRKAAAMGAEIIGCHDIRVLTKQNFGNQIKFSKKIESWTSVKSPSRLISVWSFWSHYDRKYSPILLALRIFKFRILGTFIKRNS